MSTPATGHSTVARIIGADDGALLEDWLVEQCMSLAWRSRPVEEVDLRSESGRFLDLVGGALAADEHADTTGASWAEVREMLAEISRQRTAAGFSPDEASTFVLSLKPSLLDRLRRELSRDLDALGAETSAAMLLLDTLALHAFEASVARPAAREEAAVAVAA